MLFTKEVNQQEEELHDYITQEVQEVKQTQDVIKEEEIPQDVYYMNLHKKNTKCKSINYWHN